MAFCKQAAAILFCIGALVTTAGTGAQEKVRPKLDAEVDKLVKGLRTESLKKDVKVHAEMLRDKQRREEAILFFCDIKAKGVLLAIVAERRTGLDTNPLDDSLSLFSVEDLVGLYQAAASNSEVLDVPSDRVTAVRRTVVRNIAVRTAEILEIKPTYPKSNDFDDVRTWWIDTINTAKTRGVHQTTLNHVLEHVKKSNAEERLKEIK